MKCTERECENDAYLPDTMCRQCRSAINAGLRALEKSKKLVEDFPDPSLWNPGHDDGDPN